ncbi:CCDC90 family protein [Oxalobacteraceae bacterium OTU3REALA1]|nr:CCDC90 family protein [Oxalobacteraceae bacterium OTU3REALA1]
MSSHPLPDKRRNDPKAAEVAGGGEPPYDGDMEKRVEKIEADIIAIKIDIALIVANGATKTDMAALSYATKADIAELRSATKADIAELRVSTKADIAELRASTRADIAELRASTKAEIAEAKTAIILWVVGAIFISQLLPSLLKLFTN